MPSFVRVRRLAMQNRQPRRRRRVFRRREVWFDNLDNEEVFARYRFRKLTILFLVGLVAQRLSYGTRRNQALDPLTQVLIALRYFATGAMLRLVGDFFGVSVPTVSRSIERVTTALCNLSGQFIKFPESAEDISRTKTDFFRKAGFPNVVGAVDGTFICIQAPKENEQDYVNRKGKHSLNVQMTCDANFVITSVCSNWPGSVHDSRVFRTSALFRKFESGTYKGILLGDSAYPCKGYLMTPYSVVNNRSKQKFNNSLCKTRVLIEQTYGILKRRFPCLNYMRFSPRKSCYISLACAVLHNIGILKCDIVNKDDLPQENDENNYVVDDSSDGNIVRDHICNEFFS